MSQETAKNRSTPVGLWAVIILSFLMLYRMVAYFGFASLGDSVPDYWVVAFTGDAFLGTTALIMAPVLWKFRVVGVWVVAMMWHAIGIKDFVAGTQFQILGGAEGMGDALYAVFGVGIVVHLICMYFLWRHRRLYFA